MERSTDLMKLGFGEKLVVIRKAKDWLWSTMGRWKLGGGNWRSSTSWSSQQGGCSWGSSILTLLTVGTSSFFVVGGCPGHGRTFRCIPGFCPLCASRTSISPMANPSHDNQKCFQTFPNAPGGWGVGKLYLVENHCFILNSEAALKNKE